jgi:hypothetical protein
MAAFVDSTVSFFETCVLQMEYFFPLANTTQALRDFINFQDSVQYVRSSGVYCVGVDITLCPRVCLHSCMHVIGPLPLTPASPSPAHTDCVNMHAPPCRKEHDDSVELLTGVRFVAADTAWLSPMYQRNVSVISFIAHDTANSAKSMKEFERYASALEVQVDGHAHTRE